jgi:hypothetical protein
VTNDRMRVAAWCLVMSLVTAVCQWALAGSPRDKDQCEVLRHTIWRLASEQAIASSRAWWCALHAGRQVSRLHLISSDIDLETIVMLEQIACVTVSPVKDG